MTALPRCDAATCLAVAVQHFTVGERPPGVHGLEGWPEDAPDLTDTHIPAGRVLHFCNLHAHQLREACRQQEASLYGIRPHGLMSDAERDLARRYAEAARIDPEQLAALQQLRDGLT